MLKMLKILIVGALLVTFSFNYLVCLFGVAYYNQCALMQGSPCV